MRIRKFSKPVFSSTRSVVGSELNYYTANVTFAGYIGSDNEYDVKAADEDEARKAAFELAKEDLEATDIAQINDTEWEVTIGFASLMGIEETYTVYGEDEDEAIDNAIEEASYDLDAEIVE